MGGVEERARMKHRAIIEAAQKLFLKHGVRKTTTRMIAKEANVSKVTIYKYFQSKDNVLFEVVKRLYEDYTKQFESIVYDAEMNFKSKMEAILRFEFELLGELHDDLVAAFYNPDNEELSKLVSWYTENRLLVGMQHMIREGRKEGEIAPFLEDESIMAYIDLFRRIGDLNLFGNKKVLKNLIYMFFYGIGGKQ